MVTRMSVETVPIIVVEIPITIGLVASVDTCMARNDLPVGY